MTENHLEIVKRYIAAWNRGEVDATLDHVAPDVTLDWSESKAPYGGVYSGVDAYRRLFEEMRHSFQDAWAETHEFVVSGPYVAVANTAHMEGREGIQVVARSTIVWTFDGDTIVAVKLFQDHEDALRAIGAD